MQGSVLFLDLVLVSHADPDCLLLLSLVLTAYSVISLNSGLASSTID